jgi:polyhydroxybutyrate depolymerase
MKALQLVFLFILLSASSFAQTIPGSLQHDGLTRTYIVHLPVNYSSSKLFPLVIALHGAFGSSKEMEEDTQLDVKADSAGFIVVYPQGYRGKSGLRVATWNAQTCCGRAKSDSVNDVGFISALIDKLSIDFSIDNKRIFATGFSNGGMLCYRLATELANKIAAFAPVSANMMNKPIAPTKALSILHIHSYKDKRVPYKGGLGNGVASITYQPVFEVLNQTWAPLLACSHKNDTLHNGGDFTHITWSNGNAGSVIELYITKDGGHSWPGSPCKGTMGIFTDAPSKTIKANDLIWDFFNKQPEKLVTKH